MDYQLISIIIFTFIIHFISSLSYSSKIVASRTKQIALSFAVFNALILISRLSNSFQSPFLAKRVENSFNTPNTLLNLECDFRLIIFSGTIATIIGILATPTFHRLFSRAIMNFKENPSFFILLKKLLSKRGFNTVKKNITLPLLNNLHTSNKDRISNKYLLFNMIATALWTVGVLSSIYSGYLVPEHRGTSGQLSSIINGISTILLLIIVDPKMAAITDKTTNNELSEGYLRRSILFLLISRVAGTLLAQAIFIPSAILISNISKII